MSDPIHSWVDPHELRRIGELLMAEPNQVVPVVVEEAAYGTTFEGYDSKSVTSINTGQSSALKNLADAKRLAEAGGLLARSKSSTDSPKALEEKSIEKVESGPFLARMTAFGRWLKQEVFVQSFFLIDRNGDLLLDEIGIEELTQAAYSLGMASAEAMAQSETSYPLILGLMSRDGKLVEVIPVNTHYGPMILGLLVSNRISPEIAGIVEEGIQRAVKPSEAP